MDSPTCFFCQVFSENEIVRMTIQNVLPAKGGGASYLILNLPDGKKYSIFFGPCYALDNEKDKIAEVTGLEVNTAPKAYDA